MAGYPVNSFEVETVSLADILQKASDHPVHWLKIDVEGMEKDVLESWGENPQRPWIVVVEATEPCTSVETHEIWQDELVRRNYSMQYFDGLNRFYLHTDHLDRAKFFGSGPNAFDKLVRRALFYPNGKQRKFF